MNTFELFNKGKLVLPDRIIDFAEIEWSKHPTFEGVELKHIITAKETRREFSFHLVKIAPNCTGVKHEVNAGSEGLYLFAKFLPALC